MKLVKPGFGEEKTLLQIFVGCRGLRTEEIPASFRPHVMGSHTCSTLPGCATWSKLHHVSEPRFLLLGRGKTAYLENDCAVRICLWARDRSVLVLLLYGLSWVTQAIVGVYRPGWLHGESSESGFANSKSEPTGPCRKGCFCYVGPSSWLLRAWAGSALTKLPVQPRPDWGLQGNEGKTITMQSR